VVTRREKQVNEFDQSDEKTQGATGVPQEGDEGRDSRPTEFQPVDAPTQPEGREYDDPNAKASDADFDAEETNKKE
jgi:hypothetical protein